MREASDADKLSVCLVDDGGVVADVERDENGLVQVVCGAPNVHADMWAWLPPVPQCRRVLMTLSRLCSMRAAWHDELWYVGGW